MKKKEDKLEKTEVDPMFQVKRLIEKDGIVDQATVDNNRFIDIEELGAGGMCVVHKLFDTRLSRYIARKKIHLTNSEKTHFRELFVREAQISGKLEHPNILPIHNFDTNENHEYFIDMQLVDGKTLKHYILSNKYNQGLEGDLFHALQIFLKVCEAVSFAHSQNIIHRDLKPDNVMVSSYGRVYLMDWGIAHIVDGKNETLNNDIFRDRQVSARCSGVFGTPAYLSPEQAHGSPNIPDKRSDIFALGCILYFILTKRAPYTGKSIEKLIDDAKQCKIVPPDELVTDIQLPIELCQITMKALQKNPLDRYKKVTELIDKVELFLQGMSGQFPKKHFSKGEVIIEEGALDEVAYIIVKGNCRAFKLIDEKISVLREMGPGDIFGETAILAAKPRTACVDAVSDTTVMIITNKTLKQDSGVGTWMGRFAKTLADRFIELDEKATKTTDRLSIAEAACTDAKILSELVFLLCIDGKKIDSRYFVSRWSTIERKLCIREMPLKSPIAEHIKKFEMFDIDLGKDLIFCDIKQLHDYMFLA